MFFANTPPTEVDTVARRQGARAEEEQEVDGDLNSLESNVSSYADWTETFGAERQARAEEVAGAMFILTPH